MYQIYIGWPLNLFQYLWKSFGKLSFLPCFNLNRVKLIYLIPRATFSWPIKVCDGQIQGLEIFIELNAGIYNWHSHFHVNEFWPVNPLTVDYFQWKPLVECCRNHILNLWGFLFVWLPLLMTTALLSEMLQAKYPWLWIGNLRLSTLSHTKIL